MNRKTKADYEKEFVDEMLLIGLEGYCEIDERNKTHYKFILKDGRVRYWTNMSDENLKRLGIGE